MHAIPFSFEHSIAIRRAALKSRGVSLKQLIAAFDGEPPAGESAALLVFGPHFGPEAAEELGRRLNKLNLRYVDDYFVLSLEHPGWLSFGVQGGQSSDGTV